MHGFDVTGHQMLHWTQAKFHYEFNWLNPLLYLISRRTHLFINYSTLEVFYNYQNTPVQSASQIFHSILFTEWVNSIISDHFRIHVMPTWLYRTLDERIANKLSV